MCNYLLFYCVIRANDLNEIIMIGNYRKIESKIFFLLFIIYVIRCANGFENNKDVKDKVYKDNIQYNGKIYSNTFIN